MIFAWWQRARAESGAATRLYQAALRQSREAAFYTDLGIPDSTDSHFDLTALHLVLVIDRLGREGSDGRRLGRKLVAAMCRGMEHDLRENGAGDIGVVKQVQMMVKAFNGRAHVYREALGSHEIVALAQALARNVYRDPSAVQVAVPLAQYVIATRDHLARVSLEDFQTKSISFLSPVTVLNEERLVGNA